MKILVCGDHIRDEYQLCKATRVCPEAPALVLERQSAYVTSGGAALVAENIRAMVPHDVVVATQFGSLSKKLRVFADRTLVCRIDDDSIETIHKDEYCDLLEKETKDCDAIVVSDYGKGAMSDQAACLLKAVGVPMFVDAKHDIAKYSGCFAIFPNEHEHKDIIEGAFGARMFRHVIRKLGPRGCRVDGTLVETVPQMVYDVTGAGDVFLAAFVWRYMLFRTKDFDHTPSFLRFCAHGANMAAGISVRHLGTHVVTADELVDEAATGPELKRTAAGTL